MPLTQVSSRAIEDTLRYVLGASGTDHYTFTGKGLTGAVNDPTLTLSRGHTYIFENRNSSGAHPFYIKTSIANGGTNDAYNTGVTNNGGAGGTEIVFTVPHDAPDLLYYQCSSHINMAGQLKIAGAVTDGSITESKLADDAVTADKLANSINSAIAANTAKTSLEDESVTLAKFEHGTSSNDGKFLRANNGADPSFETVNTDLVSDTSPQLGGDLDANGHNIKIGDAEELRFGDSNDFIIKHDGANTYLGNQTGELVLNGDTIRLRKGNGLKDHLKCFADAAVELYHDNVKQLETHESGIILPKAVVRGMGGSKAILGGTIDPSADKTWNFSFSTNAHGYNNGYVFTIKFYMNHWNHGNYYKYVESLQGGRGNVTGLNGHTEVNRLGSSGSNWSNGHIDFEVTLSGGTMNGSSVSLFKVKYDADGAPAWTSGYYLEVGHSGQIGSVTIT